MNQITKFAIVDSNSRRRAQITNVMALAGRSADPFESPEELMQHWPEERVLLVHDNGDSISHVLDTMDEKRCWNPMVAYSDTQTPDRIVGAMLKGALDYFIWPAMQNELSVRLQRVEGLVAVRGESKRRHMQAIRRTENLSPREREVLSALAAGETNKGIARFLGISSRTVEIHRANMMTKMKAASSSEAVRLAVEADMHVTVN